MKLTAGTFNLNNLFSRYNCKGEIKAIKDKATGVDATIAYAFGPDDLYKIRKYMGRLVKKQTKPASRFIILGDMNDPPDSPYLEPFTTDAELHLTNALAHARESQPPTVPGNIPAPPHTNWTHRFKASGLPAQYELYNQIWVSNALASRVTGAWIQRRKHLTGDGSDHDPAWIELTL